MKTRAVIGANFGDEGKGIITDYLAAQGGDVVVRFNGGCQAGHTVMVEDRRHVFSHFGSGTFAGLPTFFSQHTVINPVLFIKEYAELQKYITAPVVFIHPDAVVTTPWDMNKNQDSERNLGHYKHGSCGVGIFETLNRNSLRIHPFTMRDLWSGDFHSKVNGIRNHYCSSDEHGMAQFLKDCEWFAHAVKPGWIGMWDDMLFEGAQGLLLDQGNMEMYPHLTPSRCGMHNVRELLHERGFASWTCSTYYVSRPYLTRHGQGPLPAYDQNLFYEDDTNVYNEWQGKLRFGHLDVDGLLKRVHADSDKPVLVFTHCDQASAPQLRGIHTFGPKRTDVAHSLSMQKRMDIPQTAR